MSDDWFDRSYRSGESPPAGLDARLLGAARRATRRWTVPVIAAGALTLGAVAVLGILVSGHKLYVSPNEAPVFGSPSPDRRLEFEPDPTQAVNEAEHKGAEDRSPRSISRPPPVALPDLRTRMASEAEEAVAAPSHGDDTPAVSIVPVEGAGRVDIAHLSWSDGVMTMEFVWEGDAPCTSRLEVKAPADTRISLEDGDLVAGNARYRCVRGDWVLVEETDATEHGNTPGPH